MIRQFLVIISIFIVAFMLCGAVSATTSYISPDGKNISIKYSYVNSTLKDKVSVTKKTGAYGYGYYGTVTTTGNDIKGNNIYRTAIYFNKYHNYFTGNDFKTGTLKINSSDGSFLNSKTKIASKYLMTETLTGKSDGLTLSGTGNITLYDATNRQRLLKKGVMSIKYYLNGIYYATVKSTYIPTYKYIGNSYQMIKQTTTTNTFYANKDTRKSIITTTYTRDSTGKLIGMKTSGTSSGTEKVNGETVTYTGKITIKTKYDPKDIWDEKYTTGNYYETRTSTSPTLVPRMPLDAG